MKESNVVWQPLDAATVASYKAKADSIHAEFVMAKEVMNRLEAKLEEAKKVVNRLGDEHDLWFDLWIKAKRLEG